MDSAPVLMFVQVVGHNTSLSNLFQAGIVILYCTLHVLFRVSVIPLLE